MERRRASRWRDQADFRPVDLFDAGPSGYDAMFSLEPGAGDGSRNGFLQNPSSADHRLEPDLRHRDPSWQGRTGQGVGGAVPGFARFIREGYVRYASHASAFYVVYPVPRLGPRGAAAGCREAYPSPSVS